MPAGRPRTKPSKLPPCVYESHGAYYHVVRGVWHPLGSNLPAALEEYGRRVQVAGSPEHQLDAVIDGAFAEMKRRKVRPLSKSTIDHYTSAATKLKHLLRKIPRVELVRQRDAAMVKKLLAPTPGMANLVLSFARQVWADLLESQLVDENPFMAVKKNPGNKRTRLIAWGEWDRIYAKADEQLQCIMQGLFLTDQRIEDVLPLDETQLLEQGIYFKQQKTKKELIVAWNDDLYAWVARCRGLHGKVVPVNFTDPRRARPLFRTRRGTRPAYKTIYDRWVRAVADAGVEDCNLHDNRAFSATEAKRQGLDPQKILGHDEARTTKIYLRDREVEVVEGPIFRRLIGGTS